MTELILKLKKEMLILAVKAAIAIAITIAVAITAYYFYSSAEEELQDIRSQDKRLGNQIGNLQRENKIAQETLELYQKLSAEQGDKSFDLNRKIISELLNTLSDKYLVQDVTIKIDPISTHTEGALARNSGTVITTKMMINFNCTSDTQANAFIADLIKNFPGYINPYSYRLSHTDQLSEKVLESVVATGKAKVITTRLEFGWIGIKLNPTEPNKPEDTPPSQETPS